MRSLASQFRNVTPVLVIAYLITFLLLILAMMISSSKNIALDTFTKDPTAFLSAPFYIGAFSNIGVMFWSGSATLCFFTAYMINSARNTHKEDFNFLIVSALITLLLGVDDMFQVHEEVFPTYFNVSGNSVVITYINIFIIYILRFRNKLLSSEFIILALGFFFLGLSTVIDWLPLPMPKDTFLEDAIKLFGVVSWFIYFYRFCKYLLIKVR